MQNIEVIFASFLLLNISILRKDHRIQWILMIFGMRVHFWGHSPDTPDVENATKTKRYISATLEKEPGYCQYCQYCYYCGSYLLSLLLLLSLFVLVFV